MRVVKRFVAWLSSATRLDIVNRQTTRTDRQTERDYISVASTDYAPLRTFASDYECNSFYDSVLAAWLSG